MCLALCMCVSESTYVWGREHTHVGLHMYMVAEDQTQVLRRMWSALR